MCLFLLFLSVFFVPARSRTTVETVGYVVGIPGKPDKKIIAHISLHPPDPEPRLKPWAIWWEYPANRIKKSSPISPYPRPIPNHG
jgi:hypothetical protein